MINLKRDLRTLAWASAIALASLPASQALAAAAPTGQTAKTKSLPVTATCGSDAQGCQAGADTQRPESREPQGSRPPGLCNMNSADLEASHRLRCSQLYGPRFA